MLSIQALRAFADNYIWLLQDVAQRRCAVVDPGDAEPVQDWLQRNPGWQLADILVTHHHDDHTGGIAALKRSTGCRVIGPAGGRIPALDLTLHDGDLCAALGQRIEVIGVPGHTLDHIAYFLPGTAGARPWLFSGDTLFAGGCGRLFEGSAQQMHDSLTRLAALPAETEVFCAHEYTLANLRFACAVEPDNRELRQRLEQTEAIRAHDGISLPSNLACERATNPFLRTGEARVREAAARFSRCQQADPVAVFAALREWKNGFPG
ncbi:hydroxyacylglutathione hydrolase [Pseudomonas kuykendallii]|uniref:Hydroxyacylglutathione hydrolase n=1 Tax=Pseudomonas kuykendallii TaxID=1007099 RepID=A0A1H2SWP6_9PSED|nr:hydroxyacylglutathione hydrolase [Pseudomonas kuykendallii]MCQ4272519.1 hydroxyacylglutathione hydrolase [Pseudomonas kuykendallii]SDW36116.1 hydroxyacylglutathione hydrolase [Pseudomonas kuykendallii]